MVDLRPWRPETMGNLETRDLRPWRPKIWGLRIWRHKNQELRTETRDMRSKTMGNWGNWGNLETRDPGNLGSLETLVTWRPET